MKKFLWLLTAAVMLNVCACSLITGKTDPSDYTTAKQEDNPFLYDFANSRLNYNKDVFSEKEEKKIHEKTGGKDVPFFAVLINRTSFDKGITQISTEREFSEQVMYVEWYGTRHPSDSESKEENEFPEAGTAANTVKLSKEDFITVASALERQRRVIEENFDKRIRWELYIINSDEDMGGYLGEIALADCIDSTDSADSAEPD